MPAESIVTPIPLSSPGVIAGVIKCSHCDRTGYPWPPASREDEAGGEIERICTACWGSRQISSGEGRLTDSDGDDEEEVLGTIGLGLRGMSVRSEEGVVLEEPQQPQVSERYPSQIGQHVSPIIDQMAVYPTLQSIPVEIIPAVTASPTYTQSQSLPAEQTRPWKTNLGRGSPIRQEPGPSSPFPKPKTDRPANPLLDVTTTRVSSLGRGALYPGSVFKGTQTSGRSAYDVEVRFLDVNFPESSVSGYLSISHLTDTHPHLTTFFTGEIIGPKYGFITGTRFGATEHDDMRHWGRFEQFRRPATRADMIRPDLVFRDPVGRGGEKGRERDFVFLRLKERFLVPDHTVRDISGASFAGFYFAMIDLSPSPSSSDPQSPISPTLPKSPPLPTSPGPPTSPSSSTSHYFPIISPTTPRRQSSIQPSLIPLLPPQPPGVSRRMSGGANPGPRSPGFEHGVSSGSIGPNGGGGQRRRRESSSSLIKVEKEAPREATIRGYYFHSLNQEPFQELFLTHIPDRSSGSYEMR